LGGGKLEKGIAVVNSAIADLSNHLNKELVADIGKFGTAVKNIVNTVNWLADKISNPFGRNKPKPKRSMPEIDVMFDSLEDIMSKNEKKQVDSIKPNAHETMVDNNIRESMVTRNEPSFDFLKLKQWGDSFIDSVKPVPKLETTKFNIEPVERKVDVNVKTDNTDVVDSLLLTNKLLQNIGDIFSSKQDSEKVITPTSH
jgi:hypothetical protein